MADPKHPNTSTMAKVEPALPFDHFSGKLSSKERIVMRTRNGRTHAYAILNPYTGPLAESRKRAISTFSEAVRLCKSLPDFIPGRQNGQVVSVWYTLPVIFKMKGKGQ